MIIWIIWAAGILLGYFVCDTMHTNRRLEALKKLRRESRVLSHEVWQARINEIDRLGKYR